jgi:ribosomal protein S18 acetylase RimI-like enzyme
MELFGKIKNSELHLNAWPEQVTQQIIAMQFKAFEQSVINIFPENIDYLITYNEKKAGRLQLNKDNQEIRIINISLLAAFRNIGIGSSILQDIIKEANLKNKSTVLEVDKMNPAVNLYFRFGFKIFDENELKYTMKYNPYKSKSN